MDLQEFLELQKKIFSNCTDTVQKKNVDYTAGRGMFDNFESIKAFGISPEDGFMTRLMDKMMRINTFLQKGSYAVNDEGFQDTIEDAINYLTLLAGYVSQKNKTQNHKTMND